MKYIRTKNGIYEANDEFKIEDEVLYEKDQLTFDEDDYVWFPYGEVISQADTIKELCDEFVCVSKDNPKSYIIDDNLWGDVYPYYDSEKDYLYGAIWTDKGLIYVAKLNDKGELELI